MSDLMRVQSLPGQATAGKTTDETRMRTVAQDLETTFLAEMLKNAGLGKTRDGFGGGVGEDQFSSFLVQEQAKQMTRAGGIGLAETIFNAMQKAANHE